MIKLESKSVGERKRQLQFKDAFRINWQCAVKEAEDFMNRALLDNDFQRRLDAANILYEIKYMYSRDDVDGYLVYLDNHRAQLKGDTVGCCPIQ